MTSDGYQTFNFQQRHAGYGKFQHHFSDRTSLSLYGGVVDIWNNTPNTTNPTRTQVAQFGDNYLLDSTPLLANGTPDPYYYGYNTYHVQTDSSTQPSLQILATGGSSTPRPTQHATGTSSFIRTAER